jgi:SAM-dependent methyltransferase
VSARELDPPRCIVCRAAVSPVSNRRWTKDGFDILRCPSCGLIFRSVMPEPEELTDIYADAYFSADAGDTGGQGYADYVGEERLHRETARERLRLLAGHAKRGDLLDVGSAAGFFIDESNRDGWSGRGIDIAPSMVAWGRDRLGVDLSLTTLREYTPPPETFEAVTMWDYIEHATDPRSDVERAFELLRPGGVLALSTGDVDSPVARLSGSRWHLLTPRHHNYFFSARTLGRLLEDVGYDIAFSEHAGHRYSLRYLAHKGLTMVDIGPIRALSNALNSARIGAVRVPLNLGDIVTIVARKPDGSH